MDTENIIEQLLKQPTDSNLRAAECIRNLRTLIKDMTKAGMWIKSDLVLCSDYNPNKSESGINFWNALVKKSEAIK